MNALLMTNTTTPHRLHRRRVIGMLLVGVVSACLAGCSPKRLVVDMIGNALAGSGGVYASDDDLELVGHAVPFGLKTYESLLAVSPRHRGLLLAAGSGFVQYAYAFVKDEVDRLDATDLGRARRLRARASKLYLRGCNYLLRGLGVTHPCFTALLARHRTAALAMTRQDDVPFLYWAGASWATALTATKENLELIAELHSPQHLCSESSSSTKPTISALPTSSLSPMKGAVRRPWAAVSRGPAALPARPETLRRPARFGAPGVG